VKVLLAIWCIAFFEYWFSRFLRTANSARTNSPRRQAHNYQEVITLAVFSVSPPCCIPCWGGEKLNVELCAGFGCNRPGRYSCIHKWFELGSRGFDRRPRHPSCRRAKCKAELGVKGHAPQLRPLSSREALLRLIAGCHGGDGFCLDSSPGGRGILGISVRENVLHRPMLLRKRSPVCPYFPQNASCPPRMPVAMALNLSASA